jgi:hypothetical protein
VISSKPGAFILMDLTVDLKVGKADVVATFRGQRQPFYSTDNHPVRMLN